MKNWLLPLLLTWGCALHASPLPDRSLFHLKSKWQNQNGKTVELKELRGKKTLLAMVYLSCEYICPMIISDMKSIEGKLELENRDQIQFVLVSFDPEKDKPPVLKTAMNNRKLDPKRWQILTAASDSDVRDLAVLLDFKYQKTTPGEYSHSYLVIVLDEDGVPQQRINQANQDKDTLIKALKNK